MTHYLKIRLYIDQDGDYVGYQVHDGGYELPKEKYHIDKTHTTKSNGKPVRYFTVYVEDVGKPFDRYAEQALTEYEEWVAEGNTVFKRKRTYDSSSRRKSKKPELGK